LADAPPAIIEQPGAAKPAAMHFMAHGSLALPRQGRDGAASQALPHARRHF
jgi:hypothetical protein